LALNPISPPRRHASPGRTAITYSGVQLCCDNTNVEVSSMRAAKESMFACWTVSVEPFLADPQHRLLNASAPIRWISPIADGRFQPSRIII